MTARIPLVLNGSIIEELQNGDAFAFTGSTSGVISLVPPAVAGTNTVTLPAATDTLVGKATTDTLTNKSISGSTNTLSNIANTSLTNSTVTIGSTSVALGATVTTFVGVTLTSPTFTTPALGTPASGIMTNVTGLPISTGVSGLGTNVATALAVNVGTAGAFVVNGGALGTPISGTVTNLSGTASININGTVGATTANTGAFTTLSGSSITNTSFGTAGVVTNNASGLLATVSTLSGTYGGTGVNNGSNTITIAGNLSHTGAFTQTIAATANTSVTLPTSGTIISSVTALPGAVTGTPSSSNYLRGDGTWSAVAASGVSSFTAGTTGLTPSTATTGAVTLAGTLATTNGGTGLTSFTSGGVVYASSTSALATGSALTFDGTSFGVGGSAYGGSTITARYTTPASGVAQAMFGSTDGTKGFQLSQTGSAYSYAGVGANELWYYSNSNYSALTFGSDGNVPIKWVSNGSEQMRLNSTGLGIGTSSPGAKLDVNGAAYIKAGNVLRLYRPDNGTYGDISHGASGTGLVYNDANGDSHVWQLGGTTAMLLNSAGNLGLGVTPSAWLAGSQAFQNGGGSVFQYDNARIFVGQNTYIDSAAADRFIGNGYATRYRQFQGEHSFFVSTTNNSSGAGAPQTFIQAMTLDASGNLGVGATSGFNALSGTETTMYIKNVGANIASLYLDASRKWAVLSGTAGQLGFYDITAGAERARIDSSGNLLVGTTSNVVAGAGHFSRFNADLTYQFGVGVSTTQTTGASYFVNFVYNGSQIGSITTSAGAVTLYNTTSDQRLKENIVDAPDFGSVIDSIQVRSFDWKANNEHQRAGFVAQELVTVAPEAVHSPINEEDMMAVDYSKLVPMLVKEIQSLRKRILTLENK